LCCVLLWFYFSKLLNVVVHDINYITLINLHMYLPRMGCLLLPRRSSPAPWAASVLVLPRAAREAPLVASTCRVLHRCVGVPRVLLRFTSMHIVVLPFTVPWIY
jgi:hypothetical protein